MSLTDELSFFDLQPSAAELAGKTLLDRNEGLEISSENHHQHVIDGQLQEIEHRTKRTVEWKEVSISQIKVHELETKIQELEYSTDVLSRQNAADKKRIKSLQETVTVLMNGCNEVPHDSVSPDQLLDELQDEKRHSILNFSENKAAGLIHYDDMAHEKNSIELCDNYVKLSTQIQELQINNAKDQKIIENQRDQISVLSKEKNYLQELLDDQLYTKNEELRTLREELATFEQIRMDNLCKRCLSSISPSKDCSGADELLRLVLVNEEENVVSASSDSTKSTPDTIEGNRARDNLYRMLVEKNEDDTSRVESMFRKMFDYRQQFEEWFAVLNKTPETKDELMSESSLSRPDDRLPTEFTSLRSEN